jgi:hypothetical protein
VSLEGKHSVVTNHATAVVGDLDDFFATGFDLDLDASGTSVEGVLEEFFDHRGGPLDNFPSSNFVGYGFGENVDAAHGFVSVSQMRSMKGRKS